MPTISLTQPVALTTITAGLHAANYSALQTLLNGGLDASNWASGQIFAPSKLTQEGAATGQALVWSGTAWVPTSISADGYGTALPSSPTDGQTYVLVDSITLPTYQWRFRFNNGSLNGNKWEFVGGVPISSTVRGVTVTNVAYADFSSVPSVTVPRAGVYRVSWRASGIASFSGATGHAALKIGATATSDGESVNASSSVNWITGQEDRNLNCSASDVLKMQGKISAGTMTCAIVGLSVIPVRVS